MYYLLFYIYRLYNYIGENMKRWVKNLIMILLMILCVTSSFFVIEYANEHIQSKSSISDIGIDENSTKSVEETISSFDEDKAVENRTFSFKYYVIFAIISIILSFTLNYIILSHFNSNTYMETFSYNKRFFVYVVSAISSTILYFMFELLMGYIVLNYNMPSNNVEESALIIKSDLTINHTSYNSIHPNHNAVTVDGKYKVFLNNILVTKAADATSSEQGNNAAVSAKNGADLTINNSLLNSTGDYSRGLYVGDEGTKATINKCSIITSGEHSGAIFTNAKTVLNSSSITTSSSAGITVADNGILEFNSGLIRMSNETTYRYFYLRNDLNERGSSTFGLSDAIVEYGNGSLFSVVNNDATINLSANIFNCSTDVDNIFTIENSNVLVNTYEQNLSGKIVLDSTSSLTYNALGSIYTGAINSDNTGGYIKVILDRNSRMILTGDTYISELQNEFGSNDNIYTNGYNLYVNGNIIK